MHNIVRSSGGNYQQFYLGEYPPIPNPSNSNIVFRTFTSILPDLSASGANRPTITLVPEIGRKIEVHEMDRSLIVEAVQDLRERAKGKPAPFVPPLLAKK